MDCLVNLVKCKFLKKLNSELIKARTALNNQSSRKHPKHGYKPAFRREAKKLYDYYMQYCSFTSTFDDIDPDDKTVTYYLQDNNIVWIACKSKQVIEQAKLDSLTMNGDIPLYSGKQYIHNKVFYVVMFDLIFSVPPITTN